MSMLRCTGHAKTFQPGWGTRPCASPVPFLAPVPQAGGPRHPRHAYIPRTGRLLRPCTATKQKFGSFQELIQRKDKLVLVDFYAVWCGPCHIMADVMTKVSSGLSDRVVFVKIDTDKYPALASQYRIEALPTLVLFKDGRPIDRIEGVLNVGQLQARLQLALGPTK
ncbi:TRXY1 [Auxenochlorella protothecoides x Auxenochlorella symbiontica]